MVLLSQLLDRFVDRVLRRERELVHVPRDRVLLGAALKRGAQGGAAVLGVDVGGGDHHGFLLQSLRGIVLLGAILEHDAQGGRPCSAWMWAAVIFTGLSFSRWGASSCVADDELSARLRATPWGAGAQNHPCIGT